MNQIIFDIGSGSIGAAVARLGRDGASLLSYTTRVALPFPRELSGRRLVSGMLQTLGEASERVLHERSAQDSEVFVSLSAPWVSARTTTVTLRSERAVPITPSLLAELRMDEEAEMKGMVQIEEKLFRTTLNGYETNAPFGKRAHHAAFSLFQSFAPEGLAEQIEETILHHLPGRTIGLHAFSLIAFAGLREAVPSARHFSFVDMSGEQTEIGIVENRELTNLVSLPFGRNHLLRALGEYGLSPRVGASMLALFQEKRGQGAQFERAVQKLREASAEWAEEIRSLLTSLTSRVASHRVFLFADPDARPLFAGALAEKAIVIEVDAALLEHPDPFLAIEALVAGRLSVH